MGALSAGGLIGSLGTAATVLKTLDSTFSAISGVWQCGGKAGAGEHAGAAGLALKQLQAQQALGAGECGAGRGVAEAEDRQ